ncbi:MAG: response regulator transcription factor [Actinobacteria bacterium]|nr:response regulator transcription factor [Thermoleophilia bacterium]MCB9011049.1 response regulator transcription factor [Actinomycetota bacterium]
MATTVADTVLVVDDEPIVREIVCRYLVNDGFATLEADDGPSALTALGTTTPAIVVLDVMLPGLDGLEVCRRIRSQADVPIILLTARSGESDRIVGLELGADDYVTKPFSPRELVARIHAVLRRTRGARQADVLTHGSLTINQTTREVHDGDRDVALTAREFDLLWFMAAHPRHVFTRDQLMDRVWGHLPAVDTGTVTVHVRRLREKLESDPGNPAHIETVWGVGYRFVP